MKTVCFPCSFRQEVVMMFSKQENGSRQEDGERHRAVGRADRVGEPSAERTVWRRQLQ